MKKQLLTVVLASGFLSVAAQSQSNSNTAGTDHPRIVDNGYFKYEVTGDAMVDEEAYGKAKAAFVENYPEKYDEMIEKWNKEAALNGSKNNPEDSNLYTKPDQ